MSIREAAFETVVVERQPFMIQAHQMQQCGVEVVHRGFMAGSCKAEFVALTVAMRLLRTGAPKA